MKNNFLLTGVLAWLVALVSFSANAGDTIKLIASATAGGPQDRIARTVLPGLSAALGKPVIVDYRGGAGGTIASNFVAKAPADGETLLITTFSYVLTAGSMSNLPYDPRKDLEPIYYFGEAQTMLAARPSLRVNNLRELAAKAKDGKLSYGSNGVAGTMHLGAEIFTRAAQVSMTNIPYRGAAPALMDLLAGNVDIVNADVTLLQPYVKDGRLQGLAIFDTKRSPLLPNVPTSAEQGMPDLQMTTWVGVMAPKGLAPEVKQRLVKAFDEVVKQADVSKQLANIGYVSPRDDVGFKAKLDRDFDFWIPWLKKSGIRAE